MAHEGNLAAAHFLVLVNPAHFDLAAMRRRGASHLRQGRAEGEIAAYTNKERGLRRGEGALWPVDKAGECDQEIRLAPVLRCGGWLRHKWSGHAREQERNGQCARRFEQNAMRYAEHGSPDSMVASSRPLASEYCKADN